MAGTWQSIKSKVTQIRQIYKFTHPGSILCELIHPGCLIHSVLDTNIHHGKHDVTTEKKNPSSFKACSTTSAERNPLDFSTLSILIHANNVLRIKQKKGNKDVNGIYYGEQGRGITRLGNVFPYFLIHVPVRFH